MIAAGALYAVVNSVTALVTGSPEWGCQTAQGQLCFGFDGRSYTFLQYGIALLCTLPFLMGKGSLDALKTSQFPLHLLRVAAAVVGVELWVAGFARGLPLWTMVALLMTSPLFVIAGSALILRERVGPHRWLATITGFVGVAIVLEPWRDFNSDLLFPLVASFAWAASSLCVKPLARVDSTETITLWLLVLFTPLALLATWVYPDFTANSYSWWGIGQGVVWPDSLSVTLLLLIVGFLTAMAQLCLALSYKLGDASYVQPFDHVKLLFNIAFSWWLFNDVPRGILWLGVALILGAGIYLGLRELRIHRLSPHAGVLK